LGFSRLKQSVDYNKDGGENNCHLDTISLLVSLKHYYPERSVGCFEFTNFFLVNRFAFSTHLFFLPLPEGGVGGGENI
jgi:hypothetical protein